MDPQVVEQAKAAYPMLQQYTQEIAEWLRSGAAFVADQAPQLVTEIIRWEVANNIFGFSLGLILLLIAIFSSRYYCQNSKSWEDCSELPGRAIIALFAQVGGYGLGALFTTLSSYCLIKVLVAPRLFLLEYFARLVK